MLSLAFSAPAVAATGAVAGATALLIAQRASNRASERYTKWLRSYTDEDQRKIFHVEGLYDQHLGQFTPEQESAIKGLTVAIEPSRYRVKKSTLNTYYGFTNNIIGLCRQQKNLQLGYWFTDDQFKSPECLVLEELKIWFTKISERPTDQALSEEIEARISYYSSLALPERFTWRGRFLEIIDMNLQSLKQLKERIDSEIIREIARLKLDNLEIKGGDFLEKSLKFLFDVAKYNGLRNLDEDFSISLLSRKKELLEKDFYGKLILVIMSIKGFSKCFESQPIAGYFLEDIQVGVNDTMEANFKELCRHIRNYTKLHVNFNLFKSLNARCGNRAVYQTLNNEELGGKLRQAFETLKEAFKKFIGMSVANYTEKIEAERQWYHVLVPGDKKTRRDHISRVRLTQGVLESSLEATYGSLLAFSSIPKMSESEPDEQQELIRSLEDFIQLVTGSPSRNSAQSTGGSHSTQTNSRTVLHMAPGNSGSARRPGEKRNHDELDSEEDNRAANESNKRIKIKEEQEEKTAGMRRE